MSSHEILKSYFISYIISTMKYKKKELCLPSFQICLEQRFKAILSID